MTRKNRERALRVNYKKNLKHTNELDLKVAHNELSARILSEKNLCFFFHHLYKRSLKYNSVSKVIKSIQYVSSRIYRVNFPHFFPLENKNTFSVKFPKFFSKLLIFPCRPLFRTSSELTSTWSDKTKTLLVFITRLT